MTQSSLIQRMQTGDIGSIPVSFWALLGLAAFAGYGSIRQRGLFLDLENALVIYLAVAPFLFAAAVAFVSPANPRFLLGALALCGSQISLVIGFIEPSSGDPSVFGAASDLFLSVAWALTFTGLLLIGAALGGISTRRGWAVVGAGIALAIVQAAAAIRTFEQTMAEYALGLSVEPPNLFASTVLVGWAYLLASALDGRRRLSSLAAGLMLGLAAYAIVRIVFLPVTPQNDFAVLNLLLLAVNVAAWSALILAALTEFGPRRVEEEVAFDEEGAVA